MHEYSLMCASCWQRGPDLAFKLVTALSTIPPYDMHASCCSRVSLTYDSTTDIIRLVSTASPWRLHLQGSRSILLSSKLQQVLSKHLGQSSKGCFVLKKGFGVELLHPVKVLQCACVCPQGPRPQRSDQGPFARRQALHNADHIWAQQEQASVAVGKYITAPFAETAVLECKPAWRSPARDVACQSGRPSTLGCAQQAGVSPVLRCCRLCRWRKHARQKDSNSPLQTQAAHASLAHIEVGHAAAAAM